MQNFKRSPITIIEIEEGGKGIRFWSSERIESLREQVQTRLIEYQSAKKTVQTEKQLLIKTKKKVENIHEAQILLQSISEEIQNSIHQNVASLVTKCLQTIFDRPLTFKIQFTKSRGKTEARLLFVEGSNELDPLDAEGGGVVDVAAFGLRLAALILHKPPLRRLLLLDEPFKFLSSEKREKVGYLLEELSEELDLQIILITHDPELEIGKVIRL
jgi:DNA repair exonuclease SbcCD ATPase subunit